MSRVIFSDPDLIPTWALLVPCLELLCHQGPHPHLLLHSCLLPPERCFLPISTTSYRGSPSSSPPL